MRVKRIRLFKIRVLIKCCYENHFCSAWGATREKFDLPIIILDECEFVRIII